jgi:hypothetical protein
VPRHAAAVSQEALCYDDAMAGVVSPGVVEKRVRARTPPTKKHIVVPATAEQISKGVGVTRKDAALVRKVLLQLGYIKAETPAKARKA